MPRRKKIDIGMDIDNDTLSEIEPSKLAKLNVVITGVINKLSIRDSIGHLAYLIFRERDNLNPFLEYIINNHKMDAYVATRTWYYDREIETLSDEEWIRRSIAVCNVLKSNDRKWHDGYGIKSMLFALLLLSLDDTDKEKHLSIICDFARMLQVTDEEMIDLVNVVKYVFQDDTYEVPMNENVASNIYNVLTMYEK